MTQLNNDLVNFEMTKEDEGKVKFRDYNGQVFKIYCIDPYGFWHIKPTKGETPLKLSGSYTSFNQAERALDGYMNSIKQVEVSVATVVVPITEPEKSVDIKDKEITSGERGRDSMVGRSPRR